jgi:hypothetical protein
MYILSILQAYDIVRIFLFQIKDSLKIRVHQSYSNRYRKFLSGSLFHSALREQSSPKTFFPNVDKKIRVGKMMARPRATTHCLFDSRKVSQEAKSYKSSQSSLDLVHSISSFSVLRFLSFFGRKHFLGRFLL